MPSNWCPGEPYPLLILPQHLQEKILTKTKPDAYFNLQQTCKFLWELVQRNRAIKVTLPGSYSIRSVPGINTISIWKNVGPIVHRLKLFECPYGVKFLSMMIPKSTFLSFPLEAICDFMKKRNNTFGLLQIQLDPTAGELTPTITKLFSIAQDLKWRVDFEHWGVDGLDKLATTVLELLSSETFPNLCKLLLCCHNHLQTFPPTVQDASFAFRNYQPTVLAGEDNNIFVGCKLRNTRLYCRIILRQGYLELHYERPSDEKPTRKRKLGY